MQGHERYVGTRARIGFVIPATNTAVEYDLQKIILPGVTWHTGRFPVGSPSIDTDAKYLNLLEVMRGAVVDGVADIVPCLPDHIAIGLSGEVLSDALGNGQAIAEMRENADPAGLTTGEDAILESLRVLGARRLTVLTPYQTIGDRLVRRFFNEAGYDVVRLLGLKCGSSATIADTPRHQVIDAMAALDGDDVDTFCQMGSGLSISDSCPALEERLGKPIVPVNIALAWLSLRAMGITDPVNGLGRLMAEH